MTAATLRCVTYTNMRGHAIVYSNTFTNGTITTIRTINGNSDALLEPGEKMQVYMDFRQIQSADVKPVLTNHQDIYGKPYEIIRIELRPNVGAILSMEKEIPAVMTLK